MEWQGRVGQVWADQAEALDVMLAPFGVAGLDAMGDVAGQTVLDIGCGAGESSAALVARGAHVLGVDISDDLLDVARAREIGAHANFILGDAAELELSGPIGQIYSRFGCMFFADPPAAWSHIHGQVRAGTPMTLVAWGDAAQNDWATVPVLAARDVLGADRATLPQNGALGPFAWGDQNSFMGMLHDAGWRDLVLERADRPVVCSMGDDADALERGITFVMTIGRLASSLKGTPPSTRHAVRAVLRDRLRGYVCDGALTFKGTAWVIRARA